MPWPKRRGSQSKGESGDRQGNRPRQGIRRENNPEGSAGRRGTGEVLLRIRPEALGKARKPGQSAHQGGNQGDMAAVEEEIRIPQDPHRTEGGVFGKNQPQESTQTDERTGYPGGPRRPRQEILFLQREGRQDGTEHTRKRLPCRCLPPEGGDGRHGIQVRLGQGLFLPCHRFPQRQDPCLYALGEPEQEDGSGHAFQAAQKVPQDKKQDPAFRPGLAVPEACLPEETRGIRDHTVDVEKGELPG